MNKKISEVNALEVLDSRGKPTVMVEIVLENGIAANSIAPSGASTGSFEAIEKRDGDKERYDGFGVENVINDIKEKISKHIIGVDVTKQRLIDKILCDIDGTSNKANLGSNAILPISLASAKCAALSLNVPLFRYIGGISKNSIPVPMFNIINGGAHSNNKIDIQEFMIIPKAPSFKESLRMGSEIFSSLNKYCKAHGWSTAVGDEGGIALGLDSTKNVLETILVVIKNSGYEIGKDVEIALDVASNELLKNGKYHLDGNVYSTDKMIEFYNNLCAIYPIISIEDPLSEDDFESWAKLTNNLQSNASNKSNESTKEKLEINILKDIQNVQIVGDDLFVTNVNRIKKGVELGSANAVLIKPNQIGTLTETINAVEFAKKNNLKTVMSHRSGETEDTFIADLSVGLGVDQIKMGSICRSERVAKYNRLLWIENYIYEN